MSTVVLAKKRLISDTEQHRTKLTHHISNLFHHIYSKSGGSGTGRDNGLRSWDARIVVGHRTFYCHRLVLQLNSEYLAKFRHRSGKAIRLTCVSNADRFYDILQYMYTGEIVLSQDTVQDILSAGDVLRMEDLKQVCLRFLEDTLQSDNALIYWQLASLYGYPKLTQRCQLMISEESGKLGTSLNLTNVDEVMMTVILGSESLHVKTELEVCEMLIKWLSLQKDRGLEVQHPDKLLHLIRWPGVSVEYIKSQLIHHPTLMSIPICLEFLTRVITYQLSCVQFRDLLTFPRPSTGLENCMLAVGLSDGTHTSNEVCRISLQKTEDVTMLKSLPSTTVLASSACTLANTIYVTGVGISSFKETWKSDVIAGWIRCADMPSGRRRHCAAVVDSSSLYVLGGWVDTFRAIHSSIDCYSVHANKWSEAGNLQIAVDSAACITYRNSIYLFGGRNKLNRPEDKVQVYNSAQESCSVLDTCMPHPYWGMRAVIWETQVILFSYSTCFVYDFETRCWLERKQFRTGVGHFGLVLDNQTVFVAGGGTDKMEDEGRKQVWSCTDEVKSVSVMDIVETRTTSLWKAHAKLPRPALIHSHGFVSLPLPVTN